jgi:RNA polymerase sigma factor (sigma-70 family)
MAQHSPDGRSPFDAVTPERPHSSSARLLEGARIGDQAALEALIARYLPSLRRWAHGRLPRWARGLADTADIVQDVLTNTFHRMGGFQPQGSKALQAYLRRAVNNRIRDEIRRVGRRPPPAALDSDPTATDPSPLKQVLDAEDLRRYVEGLARLRPEDRELVTARMELCYSYEQLGVLSDRTPGAARVAVRRALLRLAEDMAGA